MDKDKIARSFIQGRKTYDSHAKIQRRVSERLIKKLDRYPSIQYDRVLEIGCCTGTLTELLINSAKIKKLFLNDLVPSFYDTVMSRLSKPLLLEIEPIFGDIETLQLPRHLDLVISSSTLQWIADIKALINKVALALQNNGYFVFSLFGPGTLMEFKEITGIGLEYFASGTIMDLLEKYFIIEEQESSWDTLFFSSPRDVLRHLQATGVGGVQEHRWTSSGLRQFEKRYSDTFGTAEGIPVSYMSDNFIVAKKG